MAMLMQLSLCLLTVIQLTSSQSTYDVIQHENDVNSCGGNDAVLSQLMTAMSQLQSAVSQIQSAMSQLQTTVSQTHTAISQLQTDAAELKALNQSQGCTTPDVNSTECPADFTYISSVNGCYKVVTRHLNWSSAGLECRSLHKDAHLLVINDAQEQLTVAEMLATIDTSKLTGCFKSPRVGSYYWTAGQRIDPSRESTFVWRVTFTNTSDIMAAMTYTNWHPGEPNYLSHAEQCMILWSGLSYTWNDSNCGNAFCSVCELDI